MTTANDTQLKELLKAFSDAELLGSELVGGFSFGEIAQLIKVGTDLPGVLKDVSVMLPEFAALDSAAQADLVAYVQANCKFPANVTVESWTQKVLSAAVMLSSLYQLVAPKV